MCQGPPATTFSRASGQKASHWRQALGVEVLQLDRTPEVFRLIEGDPRLSYNLPRKQTLAGMVLKHCYAVVDTELAKHAPVVYKFGYCHCPHTRFYNQKFGYWHDPYHKWEHLKVLYMAAEPISPGFVEAALIQRHKGFFASIECKLI